MRQGKKGSFPDQNKFEGSGVDFKCKLIGFAGVSAPRGDGICIATLSALKDTALKNQKDRKEHKQKIVLNITLKGIRLIDENTERIDHAHPISRISFISHDKYDKRTFGYIVSTKDGYKLFAIKTMKEAEVITATIKELFQEVYRRCVEKKNVEEELDSESGNVNLCEEKNVEKKDVPHKDVEKTSRSDEPNPSLGTEGEDDEVPKLCDPFDDNFTPLANTKNVNLLDDLDSDSFGNPCSSSYLFSTEPTQSHQETSENQLTQIKLDELKKNIDELHKQNDVKQQHQQQWLTGFPPPTNQHAPFATNISNAYNTNESNPFLNDSFAPTPHPIPPAGIANSIKNPFTSPQLPFNSETFVGPVTGFPDPFTFLDDKSTIMNVSAPITAGGINSAANKELLDLLG